jgi:phosphohistidine phosphatase
MTKIIYLLRHAKAAAGDAAMSDADRPLNEQGHVACAIIGNIIKKQNIKPDLVLCSTAKRTHETWELVAGTSGINSPVQYSKKLYLASAGEIIRQIHALDDTISSVLFVGHNPGIHECVIRLCAYAAPPAAKKIELKYPTGALAIIECDTPRWGAVAAENGFLKEFFTPKGMLED